MYRIIEKQNSAGTCYEMQTYDGQNSLVDTKLNTVQEHIDAAEIVRSQVYLLPEVAHGHTLIAQNLLCFQKE